MWWFWGRRIDTQYDFTSDNVKIFSRSLCLSPLSLSLSLSRKICCPRRNLRFEAIYVKCLTECVWGGGSMAPTELACCVLQKSIVSLIDTHHPVSFSTLQHHSPKGCPSDRYLRLHCVYIVGWRRWIFGWSNLARITDSHVGSILSRVGFDSRSFSPLYGNSPASQPTFNIPFPHERWKPLGWRAHGRNARGRADHEDTVVCVFYYCRTYYKAVRVGGGGHVLWWLISSTVYFE